MPSRFSLFAIGLFWLFSTGHVLERELRPRFFGDTPAVVAIEIADEATPGLPVSWDVVLGGKRVGNIVSRLTHEPSDDSFRFVCSYSNLRFDFAAFSVNMSIRIANAETLVRVTRDGRLLEQGMTGKMSLEFDPFVNLSGKAEVRGRVENGKLVGSCSCQAPPLISAERALEPVEIEAGHHLNPLMPVNRLQNVLPGKQWTIRMTDPLITSLRLVLSEAAKSEKSQLMRFGPASGTEEMLARVRTEPETLDRPAILGGPVVCWVIEYTGEQLKAWTWVAVADGRVMKQKAALLGNEMHFDRKD